MQDDKAVVNNGLFIGNSIREAWKIFKEDWISVYLLMSLPAIVAFAYMFISLTTNNIQITEPYGIWIYIIYLLFQVIIGMFVIKGFLQIVRNKKVSLATFSSVVPQFFKYLGVQVLLMLIIFGGFLLLIIPGIYFSIKYMFAPYLVIDKGMGPIEALKASGKMTHGVKWDIVGFIVAVAILMYSGILALIVGLIITMPVATIAYVVFYNSLLKKKNII